MKRIVIFLFAILMTSNLYSQKIDNDTLTSKKLIRSPWAIKFESGVQLHQMFTPDYIDNKTTQITDVTVYYKNFYFTYGGFLYEFTPKRSMLFDNILVNNRVEFGSFNLNMALGYTYNFHKKWSTDFKIGINTTSFEISNSEETNLFYESDIIMGTQAGLGLDRYIKLRGFNYIVISMGVDYYTTNYSKISPNMKPSSLNYTLTIGYKGFFRKMID